MPSKAVDVSQVVSVLALCVHIVVGVGWDGANHYFTPDTPNMNNYIDVGEIGCMTFSRLVTRNIVSAAEYRIDDGPWQAGQSGNFEAHICNGQCSNTSDASSCEYYKDTEGREQLAQVWNYGYDAVHAPAATAGGAAAPAPKRVCVRAWALDAATGERGELPEACNDMTPATFHLPLRPLAWKTQFLYSLSAEVATHMCAADGSYCRTNAHNSFDVSVADPTDVVAATTEYSIDGGAWGTASGVTFFEQKVKKVGDDWFHTFSWNYDVLTKGKGARAAAPKQICFRSWVQNRLSGETAWLDFGPDAQQGRPPTERCIAFCDHAMPFSYAPQAGGYCAQKP